MSSRFNNSLDAGLGGHSANSPHPGRPRSHHPSVDHGSYPYGRYPQDESDAYERHAHPSLTSHHSFPNLKRPYSQTEQPPYQEIVQDLRDDGSKLTVNHDHKLLSFKRVQDKHTIVDQHGRMQQLELSAQLHGMFFLSEMPSNANDGSIMQPELTCYRRNLFQISGSLITPRGQLSVVTETGETVPVSNTEVTISAIESVDGHPVRLIVIPWKTPPPNSPEITQSPDQEPASLPLIPFQEDGGESDGEYAVYPIGWRRLQFRIATANNGRRKELQQHFVLHLKVMATLANGSKAVLTESTTAPIVVRGRSPRNFQARKEIPLLGSSAGSRGQALVETGLGIVAGPLTGKPQDVKARGLDIQMPRSAFTFSAGGPKMPGAPMGAMRSNSYPNWPSSNAVPMSQLPPTGSGSYPATTMGAEPYHKVPLSGGNSFSSEPQDMPLPTSMPSVQLSLVAHDQQQPPIRAQYGYVQSTTAPPPLSVSATADSALNVPRYVDNPRPTKSPRHASQPSIHSTGSLANNESSPEYRYGSSYGTVGSNPNEIAAPGYKQETATSHAGPNRDYYPPSSSWTTTAGEAASTVAYASGEGRPYGFADQYASGSSAQTPKQEQGAALPAPGTYNSAHRGSFDGMNHYSWNTN
ncbi:Transcription factor vib-1 [Colletotrichum orbiculare MAFF 240422]|uniref:Transcription factor vib-1 n=1 Tax=Colletotrichum orbiculare (strain 104-T / ATCC 96160 / CBS 514.97 / LARS 414 / MAFF 240422) TaxID=1213857 RepID=A0A484FXV4_COLOR|nr:Transcription factor vib-1 [Colletotrichum orbiculare MAFF 240422]